MKNPFYFGTAVSGDDFCNRIAELEELKKDLGAGLNVLVYAPRRLGKTSLLRKLQTDMEESGAYTVIYFDFFSITSVEEFIQKFFDAAAKSFHTVPDKVLSMLKSMMRIQPQINLSFRQSGDISYSLSLTKKDKDSTLEEVLNLPFAYAKQKNRQVVVVFDEFQEIEQFDLENKFRSIIQTHGREVGYLFSGSKKSILGQMFHDASKAFYKSVKHVHIAEISLEDWVDFIQTKFDSTGKVIGLHHIEEAFRLTQGFPYYMQQLMFEVWNETEHDVDDALVQKAVQHMVEREYDLYSLIWSSLTPNQKKTVKYILQHDGKSLYSIENLQEAGLAATTLKSTLDALVKKDVCDRSRDQYFLVDPIMGYWVNTYMR